MDTDEGRLFVIFGKGTELQMSHIHIASAGKLAELAKAGCCVSSCILKGFCFIMVVVLDEILMIFTPRLFR